MRNRVPTFVKLPRHRQFKFKTRYYDADKEELENRIAVIKAEMEQEEGQVDTEVSRYKMTQEWKLNRTRKGHFDRSNLRVAFIAGILIAIFYYYFYL